MERRVSKSGYITAVPATGLRGWLALRFSVRVEKKAAQQASGDLCTACGHDALYHQARTFGQQRKTGVPRGMCTKCDHQERVGLLHPAKAKCMAFDDQG